jgi:ferredoxin
MITRVWLDESLSDCTSCMICESAVPEVFEVPERMVVKANPNLTLEDEIKEAALNCPVATIAIEYDNSGKRDNP